MRLLSRKHFPDRDITVQSMAEALWLEEDAVEKIAAAIIKAF